MGILEQRRHWHELIDHLEMRIANEFLSPARRFKDKVLQEYYIASLADELTNTTKLLLDSYNKDAEAVRQEIATCHTAIDMTEFYNALDAAKDTHQREASFELLLPMEDRLLARKKDFVESILENKFSDEEHYGRFLDLNDCFMSYINLDNIEPIDYKTYLDRIDAFEDVPLKNDAYFRYLRKLLDYIEGFIVRAKPLTRLDDIRARAIAEFEEKSNKQTIQMDLFCGPCKKLFSKESVFKAHLTGKKHLRAAVEELQSDQSTIFAEALKKHQELPFREFYIQCMMKHLHGVRQDTKAHVERKQSQSLEEREQEIDDDDVEDVFADDLVEDEDTDKLYNPLRLPMGWDGKPIPYWLFKLHGLGVKFPCEICGNYVYMGRKAYDKHFQEWRHSLGMKCLGIPNTKHFQDISKIDEAYALYDEMKKNSKSYFKVDFEEFEDAEGHVYNRKTFEDLHRQGLL